jgi:hypothetical protein
MSTYGTSSKTPAASQSTVRRQLPARVLSREERDERIVFMRRGLHYCIVTCIFQSTIEPKHLRFYTMPKLSISKRLAYILHTIGKSAQYLSRIDVMEMDANDDDVATHTFSFLGSETNAKILADYLRHQPRCGCRFVRTQRRAKRVLNSLLENARPHAWLDMPDTSDED